MPVRAHDAFKPRPNTQAMWQRIVLLPSLELYTFHVLDQAWCSWYVGPDANEGIWAQGYQWSLSAMVVAW
jgi:hypothetical protein